MVRRVREEKVLEDTTQARQLYRMGKKYHVVAAISAAITFLKYCVNLTTPQRFAMAVEDGISILMWKDFYDLALRPLTSYAIDDLTIIPPRYLLLLISIKSAASQSMNRHLLRKPFPCTSSSECENPSLCTISWKGIWERDIVPFLCREYSPNFEISDALDVFREGSSIQGMCTDCYIETVKTTAARMGVYEATVRWEMWRRCGQANLGFGEIPTWLTRWRFSGDSLLVSDDQLVDLTD